VSRDRYFRWLLVVLTLLVALGLCEAVLRIVRPTRLGDIAYEDIYTKTYSPTRGGMMRALVPGMERERRGIEVAINSYGQRDRNYELEKKPETYRIAVIGDSVAFGFGVALRETFAKVLEKRLRSDTGKDVQVLLFGRPGFDVEDVYDCYMDLVHRFHPDLVLYAMVLNDFTAQPPPGAKGGVPMGARPVATSTGLLKRLNRLFPFSFLRRHSALYALCIDSTFTLLVKLHGVDINEGRALDCLRPELPGFQAKWGATEQWLQLLKAGTGANGTRLLVALFPYQFQVSEPAADYYRAKGLDIPQDVSKRAIQSMVGEFCHVKDISYLDLAPGYETHGPDALFLKDDYGHPNPEGHLVAAQLLAGVVESGFLH